MVATRVSVGGVTHPVAAFDDYSLNSPGCQRRSSLDPGAVVASEAIVRCALCCRALSESAGRTEALFEFWLPLSNERADLVVVGSSMSGYEIKTERDTLRRLPRQADAYSRVFDTCSIVTTERHLDAALDVVPQWWGIIAYVNHDRPLAFRQIRRAGPNCSIDPETLVRLLWRQEVRAALVSLGSEPEPRASRSIMWQHLLDLTDLSRLREIVRAAIIGRDPSAARLRTRRFTTSAVNSAAGR